jgi:hypothetical protein
MAKVGGMLPDEKDPRLSLSGESPIIDGRIRPQHRKLYYADQTRADQESESAAVAGNKIPLLKVIFPPKTNKVELDDKLSNLNTNKATERAVISDEEWTNASKAMRNATAMAVFYLLTTDVLGPFGLPYAVATTGWG